MIRLDQDGGLWTVTIERPDKANSLTGAMLGDLNEARAGADQRGHAARIRGLRQKTQLHHRIEKPGPRHRDTDQGDVRLTAAAGSNIRVD